MKNRLTILFALSLLVQCSYAQGFVNIDFGSANIPNSTPSGSFVSMSNAIPGWTGYLGSVQQTTVLYNSLATGSAVLAILATNSPVGGVIPGNIYNVVLQAGSTSLSAAIAQTAVIPSYANSIFFTASLPYAAGWQVTIAGQNIPVTEVSTVGNGFAIFGGDISAFAGQQDELRFTALFGAGPTVNLYLDSISFSTSIVPEPGVFALVALGGLLLGYRRHKSL